VHQPEMSARICILYVNAYGTCASCCDAGNCHSQLIKRDAMKAVMKDAATPRTHATANQERLITLVIRPVDAGTRLLCWLQAAAQKLQASSCSSEGMPGRGTWLHMAAIPQAYHHNHQ
jgi:hypothetical protein